MHVFEITPQARGWRLALEGDAAGSWFETFPAAERRARWLAVRQEVRGLPAEIRILDASGALVGRWRGERFEPVNVAFARAA